MRRKSRTILIKTKSVQQKTHFLKEREKNNEDDIYHQKFNAAKSERMWKRKAHVRA